MDKLKLKDTVTRLKNFRECGDKLRKDLYDLSLKVLAITSELESKPDRTVEENEIFQKLAGLTEGILQATLNANEYHDSMLKDYTVAIKNLSSGPDGRD